MGIQGLLGALKSIQKNTHLRKYAGQTIGIDGYGWLHRGAASCALELALGKPTDRYIAFVMNRIRMLRDFGIVPYLVFDGDALPSKQGTNDNRREKRTEAKTLGQELLQAGKAAQAWQEFQKAVEITPLMVRLLIEELKRAKVRYLVAPYEADAQLVYLEKKGIIDAIMAEDSDLLVYGAMKLITKLDQYGDCIEIARSDFPMCKELRLIDWTDAMFRRMAILSGCDYLPSVARMGIKTAHGFVQKYKTPERIIQMVQYEGKRVVPPDYLAKFQDAELTFLYHRVFCPIVERMIHLTELGSTLKVEDMPYLGQYVEPEVITGVACGNLNPRTKVMIELPASKGTRPRLEDARRQTLSSPADLKPVKPITTFFKRTPLAELDPNSLTPSPSQQRLLRAATNASWQPRLVSSAPQLRPSVTAPLSRAGSINSAVDQRTFCSEAAKKSAFQPQKRQRLCSEAGEVSPSKEVKQSPFFATKQDEPSPLSLKKGRTRKARRSDFEVWSDDLIGVGDQGDHNIEQVASPATKSQPRVADTTKQAGSPQTFEAVPQSSQNVPESPSQPEREDVTYPALTHTPPQATALSPDDEGFVDLLDFHVQKLNETRVQSRLKTFINQSPQKRQAAFTSLKSSPKYITDASIKRAFSAQSTEAQAAALATLNASIIESPPEETRLKLAATFSYQPLNAQAAALKSLDSPSRIPEDVTEASSAVIIIDPDQKNNLHSVGMNPSVPAKSLIAGAASELTSTVSSAHRSPRQLHPSNGSEDALIPDSEEDDEEDVTPRSPTNRYRSGGTRSMIDLRAFAFTAQ